MDDPVQDLPSLIHSLTQTPPSTQKATIEKYFTRDASFTHPFCRTGSFDLTDTLYSRTLIGVVYRWYKIMSPRVELSVDSVAHDPQTNLLYAHITQTFHIWPIPFYRARVRLVTVLRLVRDRDQHQHQHQHRDGEGETSTSKYRIKSQEDLYQVNEFVRFFWFGGWLVVGVWQVFATFFCAVGAVVMWPQTWVEENWFRDGWKGVGQ